MVELPVEGITRRISRDTSDDRLIEDLWVGRSTSCKIIGLALKYPMNISVCIDLDASLEEGSEAPWEDRPMSPAEQARYTGIAARMNLSVSDR